MSESGTVLQLPATLATLDVSGARFAELFRHGTGGERPGSG